jgi:transposase
MEHCNAMRLGRKGDVMEIFSNIVNIPGFNVVSAEMDETHVYVSLEGQTPYALCPHCGQSSHRVRVRYPRCVRDLPMSGKVCYLRFTTRYFECPQCHVTFGESLDFVDAKRDYTLRYEQYIFDQVRQTTATYVAKREGLTDKVVTRIFLRQAKIQLPEHPFHGVKKLGIDEIAERKGRHAYDVIFYKLSTGTPLEVLETRTQEELMAYLDRLPEAIIRGIEEVCIDMWRPYATAVTAKLSHATLVTDRFHVMKAVNQDLKSLNNALKPDLPDDAKACHYSLLKNEADLTDTQHKILEKVYTASPQLKEAHQLKEAFREVFETEYSVEQGRDAVLVWIDKAEQAGLFSDAVKTIRNWFDSIVNYFAHRTTNGPAEGVNNKIKVIKRMAYGFRNFANFRIRILTAFL